MIAPRPDLEDELPHLNEKYHTKDQPWDHEPNDHCIFQAWDGSWHCWACVRCTPVGRLLVHWQSDDFFASPWERASDVIRCDRTAGESLVDWCGQEFLQSPFVIQANSTYWMFYGGYDTGTDSDGHATDDYARQEKQVCLQLSDDGIRWQRYRNEQGWSRVFVGPGAVRDPFLVSFDGTWYCYYAGHHDRDRDKAGIYVRTSQDVLHWSDGQIAQFEKEPECTRYRAESPVVVKRNGRYYLFRSHGADGPGTYVYVSDDPLNFGEGDLSSRFVTRLDTLAPEIIVGPDDREYITTIIADTHFDGIRMAKLEWKDET